MKAKKTVTPAVIAANLAKAQGSTGPKSTAGKQKSRLNALKNALFAQDVVVAAAGESTEDFEQLEASVRADLQPDGFVEEMLTHDWSVNWWRRQRVRRCESAYLQNRQANLQAHDLYLRADEIEPLKIRFQLSLERYQATTQSTPPGDVDEIVIELEDARRQLASTALGLEFLINKVNSVKKEAESTGQISQASEVTLRACAGLTNEFALHCRVVNGINKRESATAAARAQAEQRGGAGQTKEIEPEKHQNDQRGGKREAAEWKEADHGFVLVSVIEMVLSELKVRKQVLEAIEKWQAKTRLAAAVLPADSSCDRFARAETAYDRRLYRALAALLALKGASKSLP